MLEDGQYDAMVVDAHEAGGVLHLELTVLAGPHKGEVVSLRGSAGRGEPLELLGLPATITVTDGSPALRMES